jgi:hypothetical protein
MFFLDLSIIQIKGLIYAIDIIAKTVKGKMYNLHSSLMQNIYTEITRNIKKQE